MQNNHTSCFAKSDAKRKTVHIVVKDGLVQAVYADNDADVDVVVYDFDSDNNEELEAMDKALAEVRSSAKLVY